LGDHTFDFGNGRWVLATTLLILETGVGCWTGPHVVPRRRRPGRAPRGALGARDRRRAARAPRGTAHRQPRLRRPELFSAYLHTLRWNCVTATNPSSSRRRTARASRSRPTSSSRSARRSPAAREPVHRRRRGPRQDHRGRPHPPRAAHAPEGAPRRRLRAALGRASSGATRWSSASASPSSSTTASTSPGAAASAATASTPGRPTPASSSRTPCCATRPTPPPLRDWLGDFAAGSLLILDEAHNAAPRAAEVRHRLQVHPRRPRPRAALRAPPLPVGHPAQRPLQQLLRAAGDPRPPALLPRREGRCRSSSRGHGPPPQVRPARDRRLPQAQGRAASRSTASPTTPPSWRSRLLALPRRAGAAPRRPPKSSSAPRCWWC
jgi:hypothetical protein